MASVPGIDEIEVVDSRPEALSLGKERVSEVGKSRASAEIRWCRSIDEACRDGVLCIVATRAAGRRELVEEIAEKTEYRRFLLEKIVAQSVAEYDKLMTLTEGRQLKVWINCKTRAVEFHRRARKRFESDGPIQFSVFAGNHGLASNGIHSIDLFAFYDRSRLLTRTAISLDDTLHQSKRDRELFDLSGTIHARSDRGSHLTISFRSQDMAPPCYMVSSSSYRFLLDQWDRLAYESSVESGWAWSRVPFEENMLISHMSRRFIQDVLEEDRCDLPTLDECYVAHAFVLGELQPYFSDLLGVPMKHCPVT